MTPQEYFALTDSLWLAVIKVFFVYFSFTVVFLGATRWL